MFFLCLLLLFSILMCLFAFPFVVAVFSLVRHFLISNPEPAKKIVVTRGGFHMEKNALQKVQVAFNCLFDQQLFRLFPLSPKAKLSLTSDSHKLFDADFELFESLLSEMLFKLLTLILKRDPSVADLFCDPCVRAVAAVFGLQSHLFSSKVTDGDAMVIDDSSVSSSHSSSSSSSRSSSSLSSSHSSSSSSSSHSSSSSSSSSSHEDHQRKLRNILLRNGLSQGIWDPSLSFTYSSSSLSSASSSASSSSGSSSSSSSSASSSYLSSSSFSSSSFSSSSSSLSSSSSSSSLFSSCSSASSFSSSQPASSASVPDFLFFYRDAFAQQLLDDSSSSWKFDAICSFLFHCEHPHGTHCFDPVLLLSYLRNGVLCSSVPSMWLGNFIFDNLSTCMALRFAIRHHRYDLIWSAQRLLLPFLATRNRDHYARTIILEELERQLLIDNHGIEKLFEIADSQNSNGTAWQPLDARGEEYNKQIKSKVHRPSSFQAWLNGLLMSRACNNHDHEKGLRYLTAHEDRATRSRVVPDQTRDIMNFRTTVRKCNPWKPNVGMRLTAHGCSLSEEALTYRNEGISRIRAFSRKCVRQRSYEQTLGISFCPNEVALTVPNSSSAASSSVSSSSSFSSSSSSNSAKRIKLTSGSSTLSSSSPSTSSFSLPSSSLSASSSSASSPLPLVPHPYATRSKPLLVPASSPSPVAVIASPSSFSVYSSPSLSSAPTPVTASSTLILSSSSRSDSSSSLSSSSSATSDLLFDSSSSSSSSFVSSSSSSPSSASDSMVVDDDLCAFSSSNLSSSSSADSFSASSSTSASSSRSSRSRLASEAFSEDNTQDRGQKEDKKEEELDEVERDEQDDDRDDADLEAEAQDDAEDARCIALSRAIVALHDGR